MRSYFRTGPVDHTRRSLKGGKLLNARGSLGKSIIEIVAADVAVQGEELERRLVGGSRKAGLPE
jgi:hypothetical protein